jgi:hypothetical protein
MIAWLTRRRTEPKNKPPVVSKGGDLADAA